jgi:hypothetical protein
MGKVVLFSASRKVAYKRGDLSWGGQFISILLSQFIWIQTRGCRGSDRMVVGFITTYAISAYHH